MFHQPVVADPITVSSADGYVPNPDHPMYLAFLETMRDPSLAHRAANAGWRDVALATILPSDGLPDDVKAYDAAITTLAALDELEAVVSLAVAARRKFGDMSHWNAIEADALAAIARRQG